MDHVVDHHKNDVLYVKYTRDALGNYAPAQDFNFYHQFSGAESHWDHQVSTTSNALGWEGLDSSLEMEFDHGIESTPFGHNDLKSPFQQAPLSATQPLLLPATPQTDEIHPCLAPFNFVDSPVVTPPLSPLSSFSASHSVSSFEDAPFIHSRSSPTSHLSLTAPILPPSTHLPAILPTITTTSLPTDVASMLQTPTTQYNSPTDEGLDALLAMLCQNIPQPTECTNLTTAFTQPDQFALRALLDRVLASPWLITHGSEPKDEKNRSILLGFLAHEATGGTYRCLFDGCQKSLDRQDRALGHIRMHVGHRPHACNGVCGVPECQERFYCQSYLRSHAKRQKSPCDICQQFFFRRDLRKHRLCCQGIQNKAQHMPHHSTAAPYARSMRPIVNVVYGR